MSVVTYTRVEKNIYVHRTLWLYEQVTDSLAILKTKEVGNRLIKKIGEENCRIYIKTSPFPPSTVVYRKKSILINMSQSDFSVFSLHTGEEITNPFFIVLAHELIHAHHHIRNKKSVGLIEHHSIWTNMEEYKTIIGIPSKNPDRIKPKITENSIRLEHGLPERFAHLPFINNINQNFEQYFHTERVKLSNHISAKRTRTEGDENEPPAKRAKTIIEIAVPEKLPMV